uniref:Uncharacterized protein n=1 Tax=Cyanothece sp. (strain PCC 7425 / ATCC 29141) TaxID=395961 RepID=B8HTC3_CYAP4
MDWPQEAKRVFNLPKPAHFTDYHHCCECAEHDQTLSRYDVDSIGLEQLGNPGWDPLCFCSPEGLKYYLPAMMRLTLETIATDFYLDQMVFHLIYDGPNNRLVQACTPAQRQFVVNFLSYLIDNYPAQIEASLLYSNDIFIACDIWSNVQE